MLILAACLVFALGAFAVEMFGGILTPAATNFLRALEFVLAIAIGTVVQLILSRENHLKQERSSALSAYRRTLDTRKAISRLKAAVANSRVRSPIGDRTDLDVFDAIADGLLDTADSSIGDWQDIIGPEMSAVNRITAIRSSLKSIGGAGGAAEATEEQLPQREQMEAEIDRLRAGLPPVLQTALGFEEEVLPRDGRLSFTTLRYLRDNISANGYIRILVGEANVFDSDLDQPIPEGPFWYSLDYGMSHEYMMISNGVATGLVQNPLEGIGVYYKDYQASLRAVLPRVEGAPPEMEEGAPPEMMERVEIVGSEFNGLGPEASSFYVRVPITEEDFLQAVRYLDLPMT